MHSKWDGVILVFCLHILVEQIEKQDIVIILTFSIYDSALVYTNHHSINLLNSASSEKSKHFP